MLIIKTLIYLAMYRTVHSGLCHTLYRVLYRGVRELSIYKNKVYIIIIMTIIICNLVCSI